MVFLALIMAMVSRAEAKDMYSWWWDSHISPKNSKWLQENLTGNILGLWVHFVIFSWQSMQCWRAISSIVLDCHLDANVSSRYCHLDLLKSLTL